MFSAFSLERIFRRSDLPRIFQAIPALTTSCRQVQEPTIKYHGHCCPGGKYHRHALLPWWKIPRACSAAALMGNIAGMLCCPGRKYQGHALLPWWKISRTCSASLVGNISSLRSCSHDSTLQYANINISLDASGQLRST